MKKILYIFMTTCLILSMGCSIRQEEKVEVPIIEEIQEKPEELEEPELIDPIKIIIDNMSLEEKVGQLFIVGLEGKSIDTNTEEFIDKYKISGFILFKKNIGSKDETEKLISQLKRANKNNKVPLFISIDEEGGNVSRLSHIYGNMVPASQISKNDNIEESFKYGEEIGRRLLDLGFNLDYAPVLDINTNPNNPVIGNRAYGNTANSVIKHGLEVMRGIDDSGVISCIKHFPGHGDTIVDSHIGLPRIDKTLEELKVLELLPFIKAIEEDVDMIMVAHILFNGIDEQYPASMSKAIITDLLREELKYKGVIISDDLTMGGIINNYKIEDAVAQFIKAGGDIALIAHNEEDYINSIEVLKSAIEADEVKIEDIDESLYRILSLKNILYESEGGY